MPQLNPTLLFPLIKEQGKCQNPACARRWRPDDGHYWLWVALMWLGEPEDELNLFCRIKCAEDYLANV